MEKTSAIGVSLQIGYETEVTAGFKGVSATATIPPQFTRAWSESNSLKETEYLFTRKEGMVSIARGMCIQYQVSLCSFELPLLTDPFISSLGKLYDVRNESEAKKKKMFKRFIRDFGTHFMKRADLGASFAQKSDFSGSVRNDMSYQALEQCTNKQGVRYFGIQLEKDTSQCTSNVEEQLSHLGRNEFSTKIITKGSRPTDIKDWAIQKFNPIPLRFTFSPIVNLFRKKTIEDNNLKNEFGKKINSSAIRAWFLPLYHDFCATMGIDCKKPTGCGIDDKCPLDIICDSQHNGGHECTGLLSFSLIFWLNHTLKIIFKNAQHIIFTILNFFRKFDHIHELYLDMVKFSVS